MCEGWTDKTSSGIVLGKEETPLKLPPESIYAGTPLKHQQTNPLRKEKKEKKMLLQTLHHHGRAPFEQPSCSSEGVAPLFHIREVLSSFIGAESS